MMIVHKIHPHFKMAPAMSKVDAILDIMRDHTLIGVKITTANGLEFDFRDWTVIIHAYHAIHGLIHAIMHIKPNDEELMRLIIARAVENEPFPVQHIWLDDGSYGITYPDGEPMGYHEIRGILEEYFFETDVIEHPIGINVYSLLDNMPVKSPKIMDEIEYAKELQAMF